MKKNIFEDYSVPKSVAYMALPTMLSMLVNIFYNMADTYFVGQMGDEFQLAAVSLTTPIFFILMAVGNIFGVGGSAFISRMLGGGEKDKVKNISSFCFYGCVISGIIVMVTLLFGMEPILKMIGCSPDTIGFAREYLEVIGYGSIFIIISFAFGNIIRSEGAAFVSMTGMILGTIINIALDYVFIIEFGWGVKGAAIATVIGNIFVAIFYIIYLLGKKTMLSISPICFRPSRFLLFGVLSVGIPASINNVLMSASSLVLNLYLKEISDVAVGAMGVATKANMMVVMLQLGLAMGIQPLIGYNYGAGNIKKQKKIMKFAMMCTLIIGSVMTIIYVFNLNSIVSLFTEKTALIGYGETMLRALMISGPFIGVMFVFSFTFQAMGRTVESLVLSISRQGFVFLPVVMIGYKVAGLDGLVYAQPIADLVSLLIALALFMNFNKRLKRIEDANYQLGNN